MKKTLILAFILCSLTVFTQEETTAQINKLEIGDQYEFILPLHLKYSISELEKLLFRIKRENPEILNLIIDSNKTIHLTTSDQLNSQLLFNKLIKRFGYSDYVIHSL